MKKFTAAPSPNITFSIRCAIAHGLLLLFIGQNTCQAQEWTSGFGTYQLTHSEYQMDVSSSGFRFGFSNYGDSVQAHSSHGLAFGNSKINNILQFNDLGGGTGEFRVRADNGELGTVTVFAAGNSIRMNVRPDNAQAISTQVGGLQNAPAYGLADAGVTRSSANLQGSTINAMRNDGNVQRFGSSFLIHPSRRFAGVSFYNSDTTVTTNNSAYSMTAHLTGGAGDAQDADFHYFLGDKKQIYSEYRDARVEQGYAPTAPKQKMFEIGYESWDQLRWNANGVSVQNSLNNFVNDPNYKVPVKWAVTGSGFWKDDHTTTSFGELDTSSNEFPLLNPGNPGDNRTEFGEWTEQNDIAWLIGQRTSFIRDANNSGSQGSSNNPGNADKFGYVRGPFTDEAEAAGYFVDNLDGTRYVSENSWYPKTPAYVLDGSNQAAADWFNDKFELWKQYGIDGIKEDTGASGATSEKLKRLDVFNKPIEAIANNGSFVMNRNGAFTLPGTLHRINDTGGNPNTLNTRVPISYMQYAASGAPNAYADSVGIFSVTQPSERDAIIRNAWVQALTGGMSFSVSPFDPANGWSTEDKDAIYEAVKFRQAIVPYLFSAAVESYNTGYPSTMTPLHIAFADDPNVHNLANTTNRQFEWMIGDSILAAPLLNSIENGAVEMDVYLPEGTWIDYHTGVEYSGNQTLEDFIMEKDRAPIFVGGKGILALRSFDESSIWAEIFPNAMNETSFTLYYEDLESSEISTSFGDWDLNLLNVRNLSTNELISYEVDSITGAIRFNVAKGHDYQLQSVPEPSSAFAILAIGTGLLLRRRRPVR